MVLKLGKKAQRETAGQWVLLLILYYIFLGLILTAVGNIGDRTGYINGTSGAYIDSGFAGECVKPREVYNADGDLTEVNSRSTSCLYTLGAFEEEICDRIVGCSFENVTTGIFWWADSSSYCTGNINKTYYNGDGGITLRSVSNYDNVNKNETACLDLGFKWSEELPEINAYSFWDLVKDIFTNNLTFGFENESINNLLAFIFVYLPILILSVAFYILIR